jgi:BirA family biotin operon repressor/biotin-[acetyl-CoA-carboxylase] ligase
MATPILTHHLEEVGSTQDEARLLAESSGTVPLLLVADRQTRGKGRAGHSWLTAPRALACSLVVAPDWETDRWSTVPLLAGLEARRAIRDRTGVKPSLKWPNDLVTPAGKIGGLLVESSGSIAVIGLGVNLWWPEPPEGMAGLLGADPGREATRALAESWAARVVARLEGPPGNWGHEAYRDACSTLGTFVTWEPDGVGEAVDIAIDGGLVVETTGGRVTLHSGEVHTIRPTSLASGDDEGVPTP